MKIFYPNIEDLKKEIENNDYDSTTLKTNPTTQDNFINWKI